jgi:hypothetical protein
LRALVQGKVASSENKRVLCARPLHITIFRRVLREEEGERHHFKRGAIEMEAIPNLCANKKTTHKDHARRS